VANFRDRARRAARGPAAPFLRYFNRRFEDVHGHLDNQTESLTTAARGLQERVATDVEVVSELVLTLERFADRFGHRMDEVLAELGHLLAASSTPPGPRRAALTLTASDDPAQLAAVLEPLHEWLSPAGELALTVPSTTADDSGTGIGAALPRWEVVERRVVTQPDSGAPGFTMVRLTPRG
jgi:hypothetical protein